MKLFVFGLGYSATSAVNCLAPHCKAESGWIAATTRNPDKAANLEKAGIRSHIFDGTAPGNSHLQSDLEQATHILVSIGPGAADPVLSQYGDIIIGSKCLEWIGYYSTVGVYGDHLGAWVDEAGECRPVSRRSKERVEAENAWMSLGNKNGVAIAVLRLAGIYGPGRNAFVNLKTGKARRIIKPGQVFNRIHVDDIGAITAAMARQKASGIFNGADDEPAPPQDVVEYAAKVMNVPIPPDISFDRADLSPMGRSFYGETKRVANGRLRDDLGLTLTYPDYRKALDTLWKSDSWDEYPPVAAIT